MIKSYPEINKKLAGYSTVSLCMFAAINLLFIFKYGARISFGFAVSAMFIYLIFIIHTWFLYNKFFFEKTPYKYSYVILMLVSIFAGVVFDIIPKESLNVDRWEIIQIFIDSFCNGVYPYGVKTVGGNFPGPMPFYYAIAYPFYAIGELGWMTIAALWLMLLYLLHIRKRFEQRGYINYTILLLVSSSAIYWEIFTRSNIFLNSLIFAIWLFALDGISSKKPINSWGVYALAMIGGIIFSTRNVFILPMIVWGIYALRNHQLEFYQITIFAAIFLIAFIATFIPIIVIDPTAFLSRNPFLTQGNVLLPFYIIIVFVVLSVAIGFICRNQDDVCFGSGILLFSVAFAHIIFICSRQGWQSIMTTGPDISYLIFSFPFLLRTIVKNKGTNNRADI